MLGTRAAEVIGADLIGVDLLPASGGYVVLELNGAVEFDRAYDIGGSSVFVEAAAALGLPRLTRARMPISSGTERERARVLSHRVLSGRPDATRTLRRRCSGR